jgi:nicotinamide riboside kinase
MAGFVIGLLGAESTGKTTLAAALGTALAAPGRRVAVVSEYLREFCDRERRTPREDEQAGIATEQTRRIDAAAATHDLVIADTTALMIAVYSELVFGDRRLYADALRDHARCNLTLLTAIDLPWQPDVLRDGPAVRVPVDQALRAALNTAGLAWSVVGGSGDARCAQALAAVERALAPPDERPGRRWQWVCERCGEAACERHRLPRL